MDFIDKAFQPLGSTVKGKNGNSYLNSVDAINANASNTSGSHKDKAGRYWDTAAERDRADINIDKGESWRGAEL